MSTKMKTKSAAKKRFFKVGGSTQKLKHAHAYRRHLLTKKSAKRKRKLRKRSYTCHADYKRIRHMLPY